MIEQKEVIQQFKKDLSDLLKNHNAVMEVVELPSRYAYSTGKLTIKVYIPADYREDGKCIAEWAEIDLGGYVDGK